MTAPETKRNTVPLGRISEHVPESAPRSIRDSDIDLRITRLEEENKTLKAALARSESQTSTLMRLYVTLRQMHSALEPGQVLASIVDSLSNLLGAEEFAVLFSHGEPLVHALAFAEGKEIQGREIYAGKRYRGGDPLIDEALSSGTVQIGSLDPRRQREGAVLAAVPLTFRGRVFGCVVIERLLAQRSSLDEDDRMLLELLADQAGSALLAARAYSARGTE